MSNSAEPNVRKTCWTPSRARLSSIELFVLVGNHSSTADLVCSADHWLPIQSSTFRFGCTWPINNGLVHMFKLFKKKKAAATSQPNQKNPPSCSNVKRSLLSLEPRLMFDAAAAATASEVASEQVAQEQAEAAVSSDNAAESRTTDQVESQGVLDAIATYNPGESRTEVVFVDPTVPNYQELLSGMDPNIEVIMLDGGQDGVEQMATTLSGRSGIDAIHLISHGSSGQLQLGTGTLNADSMSSEYADELATIQQSLSEQADILVYGCDFAEGDTGQAAVNLLAELTGADVQASTDLTGNISLGGDWDFEVSTGTIETALAIDYDAQMNWAGLLGTETVKDTFSAESYANNKGTESWSSSWSEIDADGGGASGGDVQINSGQLRIDTDSVGNAISRGVDLSHATSATLTFKYTNRLSGGDRIELRVSTDGGANYQTLSGGIFSNTTNPGGETASFDLSGYMSANTRIQFLVTGTGGGDRLYVDNVQVSYDTGPTNTAPTISNLSGDRLRYTEGDGAVVIDRGANALVSDSDSANFDSGQLTVSIPYGNEPTEDVLSIRHQGSGIGQIGVSENIVTYEGVAIGACSGGAGGNNLVITFNSNATPMAVSALVKNITYEDINNDSPAEGSLTIRFALTDGDGGRSTNSDVSAYVRGVNDAPIDLSLSANRVPENAVNGTVVGTITSTDPDSGDSKRYSLTDNTEGRFAINNSTGVITVANGSLLNYEAAATHHLTVRVTDSGGLTYDETFTIHLTDVNEAAPTITSNGGGATASITVAEHTTTVTTVTASDADARQTLTYSIVGGADAAQFTIDSSTGALSFITAPNYESPTDAGGNNVYDVTVQVSDGHGGVDTQAISVTVTDMNEGPTGADATITIDEDTSHTLTTANFGFSDVDAGDSLSAVRIDTLPTAGSLTLSGVAVTAGQVVSAEDIAAGHLVFTPAADANGTDYARLTFSVQDSHNTYDAAPHTLTFNVTAVNDAPVLVTNEGGRVSEGGSIALSAKNLAVIDADTGADELQYQLTALPANGLILLKGSPLSLKDTFTQVDIDNGIVEYQHDGSETDSDGFAFIVEDGAGGALSESTFKITIAPTNDAPTDLSLSSNTVAENAATGTVVGTVTGTDPDASDTKTYRLTDTAGGRFAINAGTGEITVADGSLLNYESAASHTVTVRVTDSGGLSYDETFTINLTNVNEGPTDLSLSANTVAEQASTGTVVGTVTGTDPDTGDTMTYSLTDTAGGRFAIDPTTGVLTVVDGSLLNYEAAASHTVTVQVTESGGLSYDKTFTIQVSNVQEAQTVHLESSTVDEGLVSSLFINVEATQPGASQTVDLPSDRHNEVTEAESYLPKDAPHTAEVSTNPVSPVEPLTTGRHPTQDTQEQVPIHGRNEQQGASSEESATTGATDSTESPDAPAQESGPWPWSQSDGVETAQDESTSLGLSMAAGLAGMVWQGGQGTKEKMTSMKAQIQALHRRNPSQKRSQRPDEDEQKESTPES